MFLANIAFALNLIALAIGAFLVGWGVYKAEKCAALYMNTNPNLNPNVNPNVNLHEGTRPCAAKGHCATTFAKVFGVIVMILAIIGLVCTAVCAVKAKHYWHEKKEMMEQNSSVNTDQTNTNLNTNPNPNDNTTPNNNTSD